MRPRREVLLLVSDEEQLGRWRMRCELWGYRACGYQSLDEAFEHLSRFPVDAIATNVAGTRGADALAAGYRNVLLFGTDPRLGPGHAHRHEPDGPALPERVRAALRIMVARRRGPQKKPVQSVTAAELQERVA